jgi:hypothetical protein
MANGFVINVIGIKKMKEKKKLNIRQEAFCKTYVSETEFFGNGTQSYIEVYKPKRIGNWYRSCQTSASDLLSNPIIIDRINELLQLDGLNDTAVDKQLSFVIAQYSDLTNKVAAIKEYNKLKQRITEKSDIMSGGKPISLKTINYGDHPAV